MSNSKNPYIIVAETVKAINDYYKENYKEISASVLEANISKRIKELKVYALKNNIPIVLTTEQIIKNVKDLEAGEIEEDEYENSESEYDDSEYDD